MSSKIAFATIEALATLLIVLYISILRVSFELISRVDITTDSGHTLICWAEDPEVVYFRGAHGFLAFVACVLIAFYLIPMPLVFLFPTVLYKNKYLKKYKPFYDVFWNPFKPSFRFWLGMRLIFRWIPLIAQAFSKPPTSTFVTAFFLALLLFFQMQVQPFESKWINTIDNLFLLNLIFLFLGSLFFNATVREDVREKHFAAMEGASNYTVFFCGHWVHWSCSRLRVLAVGSISKAEREALENHSEVHVLQKEKGKGGPTRAPECAR